MFEALLRFDVGKGAGIVAVQRSLITRGPPGNINFNRLIDLLEQIAYQVRGQATFGQGLVGKRRIIVTGDQPNRRGVFRPYNRRSKPQQNAKSQPQCRAGQTFS